MGENKPQVSLCMIVKDEAENLPRCLSSVYGLADEIVIVDTGSADDTRAAAERFGARVFSFAWVDDFSSARNYSLEQAGGEWVLVMDADEELAPGSAILLRPFLQRRDVEGLFITMVNFHGENAGTDLETYLYLKIFRNRSCYRYTRPLHEQLLGIPADLKGFLAVPEARCLHYGYLSQYEQKKDKSNRNFGIIRAEIERSPDAFNYLSLAQEYFRAGRLEEAVKAALESCRLLDKRAYYGAKLYKLLGTGYCQLERYREALEVCREGVIHYPDYPDLVYLLGAACLGLERYAQAVGFFRQCLAMGSLASPLLMRDQAYTGYRAYLALGQAYFSLGKVEDAIECYRRALGLNPDCLSAAERVEELLRCQSSQETGGSQNG